MKLARAAEMRAMDRQAIEDYGIPGVVLMENAGRAVVEAICRWQGPVADRRAVIVVGPGNNGGDGLVIARHLHQAKCRVQVVALVSPDSWQGDAAINWQIVRRMGIPVITVTSPEAAPVCEAEFAQADFLVDAIFGTGLTRPVLGHFAAVIEMMNQSSRSIAAVDIPSGLESDSGRPLGACVRAGLTVTFVLAKPGHVVHPGAEYTGRLEVADIGIPEAVIEAFGLGIERHTRDSAARLLPARQAASHKGTFGHVLVLAGSQGKTGAAILAAQGALRSGAGLVTLAVPRLLNPVFEAALFEAMTVSFVSDYCLEEQDAACVAAATAGKDAVVIGPGLGTAPGTAAMIHRLYREVGLPMVVDADALAALGTDLPPTPGVSRVLTPHPGEMAKITGLSVADIQADRIRAATDYAQAKGVVVLLKGAGTVVAAPDGRVAINVSGNPGMAAGGMGDVLAGVIGALLGQGLGAWEAACLGAFVHGLAADRLARTRKHGGFLASEVAAELPAAFHEIAGGEREENAVC